MEGGKASGSGGAAKPGGLSDEAVGDIDLDMSKIMAIQLKEMTQGYGREKRHSMMSICLPMCVYSYLGVA